ncbi:MAG: hypothetical protein RL693_534 [Verrucomicrobiota bacterium]|jgi:hypothetical protein
MNFLKRIELWVLLLLVAGGIAYVLTSRSSEEDDITPSNSPTITVKNTDEPLQILRTSLKRDYQNARLDLTVRVRNDGASPLPMQSPKVKLLTDKNREAPSFFLPFEKQPEVGAKSTGEVQLRYWLEASDLQGGLSLEVDGKTLPVKSAKPLDINTLKNAEEKVISGTDW